MTLVLEVEYLSGVSFAAIGPDSPVPDWPPQPDRVFSALVAAWAARGQSDEESQALRWLEEQPAPAVVAPSAEARSAVTVFVPPNDSRSDRQKNAGGILPSLRRRQPRRFPAVRLTHPILRFLWNTVDPDETILKALDRLARDTVYVGHSASLTRCRFLLDLDPVSEDDVRAPARRVYPGRFEELREAFARFEQSGHRKDRPQKGAPAALRSETLASRLNVFDEKWLLLEHVDGSMPDLRACALVAKVIRDAILSGYRRIGLEDRIPEIVSGHSPDGRPSQQPHLAIVPLAFVGFSHADGHVLGFALVPPSGSDILRDESFRKALRAVAPLDEDRGRRILTVTTREGTPDERAFSIDLSPCYEAVGRSLDPLLYTRRARTFGTLTPIALDRHLKEKGDARQREIASQIAAACRHVGLPEPESIVPDKHSALEGAPSAYPSGHAPSWTRWQLPAPLTSRQLTHAVIRFAEPIEGPVLLGAGRYLGLGLCRPLDSEA